MTSPSESGETGGRGSSGESGGPAILEERRGGALRIVLNRPAVLNALTPAMLDALAAALEQAAADDAVRAVLLSGAGRGFCAGADLAATPVDGDIGAVVRRHYNPVVTRLAGMPKPVIAAVNGVAAGAGLSLALACDLRWLAPEARFAVGFPGIALALDAGASWTLPRLVGRGRAFELIYSNRRVDAEEALALGLGEEIVEGDFAAATLERAAAIAAGPTRAFGLIKGELNAADGGDLAAQLEREADAQAAAGAGRDVHEGLAAFREKRAPDFEGR